MAQPPIAPGVPVPPPTRPSYDSLLSAIDCLEHSKRCLRAGNAGDADVALALLRDAVAHLDEVLCSRRPPLG